jgi:hypothetical protein
MFCTNMLSYSTPVSWECGFPTEKHGSIVRIVYSDLPGFFLKLWLVTYFCFRELSLGKIYCYHCLLTSDLTFHYRNILSESFYLHNFVPLRFNTRIWLLVFHDDTQMDRQTLAGRMWNTLEYNTHWWVHSTVQYICSIYNEGHHTAYQV